MRIVAISDTHGMHERLVLPPGDVLVHAGDWSESGEREESEAFLSWLGAQPYDHKVIVAGNHDFFFEREPEAARALLPPGVTWLQDGGCQVRGFRFWGASWTPRFFRWAFMLDRGSALRERWDLIPAGIDVLVTHGPPYGHGDQAVPLAFPAQRAVGCLELTLAVRRVRPRLHVFGHIHEGHGLTVSDEIPETRFANAAIGYSEPRREPLVLDL